MTTSKYVRSYPVKEHCISEEDLTETKRLLIDLKCSEAKAPLVVKTWMEHREKCLENIECFEKKLNNLNQACNVAHGVGAALEVVGGVAMIAGAIFNACGHKEIGEFLTKKVTPVTVGAGVATSVSSSVAELGLTCSTMRNVQMVLKKDEEITKLLMENLEHSKKIDSYLRAVFNCSVLSNNFLDVIKLCMEGISLLEIGYVEISEIMNKLKQKARKSTNIVYITETVMQNVSITMKKISTDPKVQKAVKNICGIIQQSPSTVEFIKLGLRVSIQVCDILKVDIFTHLLGIGVLKTSAGVMATQCLLGAVLVAVNVLSVISAAQNVKEESSKYSKMLQELHLALTMELNTVRKNYSKLL